MNLARYFSFPSTLPKELKSNFILLFWDIAWWGLYAGATASFLTIYATRCGATPEQIGWLTAAPAVISLALSLPAGRLLKRVPVTRATVISAFLSRIFFLAYALLPWLFPVERQVIAILALAAIITIPTTIINISFSQFFMEAVPPDWRGTVAGVRIAIFSIVSFIATVVSGEILTRMTFPSGYQVVFMLGFIGGIMTVAQLIRVRPFHFQEMLPVAPEEESVRKSKLGSEGRHYFKVLGLLFLFNTTNNMVAPLVPDLLVHKLNLSDGVISIGTATSSMLVFLVSASVIQITRQVGNRKATAVGAMLLSLNAVALSLAQDVTLYMAAAVIGGISSGILGAAQYNYHLENVPKMDQPTWLSWALLVGNAAILLGALAGPFLAGLTGAPSALILFGVLRLAAGLLILKWG